MNTPKLLTNISRILLGLLGITVVSCKFRNNPGNIPPCAYGPPPATYEIKGTVINEDGEPINNIAVTCRDLKSDYKPSSKTDEDGQFSISCVTDEELKTIDITFVDVDGSANNGTYQTIRKSINVSQNTEAEVKVIMKERDKI